MFFPIGSIYRTMIQTIPLHRRGMDLPLCGGFFFWVMNKDWKQFASNIKDEMMFEKTDPETGRKLWFRFKFRQTMYESPKTFSNDYAFNTDGTWLRFPREYRTKDGKPKGLFFHHKKDVVKELMFFCRFQKLIGVETKDELVYHMACFLADVVKLYNGVFTPTKKNVEILNEIAERILVTECSEDTLERLKDARGFCIDPKRLEGMNESMMSVWRNKGTKIANYLKIKWKYDETKSKAENAVLCGVSESTISRFRREREQFEKLYNALLKIDEKEV